MSLSFNPLDLGMTKKDFLVVEIGVVLEVEANSVDEADAASGVAEDDAELGDFESGDASGEDLDEDFESDDDESDEGKSDEDESDEDKFDDGKLDEEDGDNSEEDKSDEDNLDKDKSDEDILGEDKSDEDKSEESAETPEKELPDVELTTPEELVGPAEPTIRFLPKFPGSSLLSPSLEVNCLRRSLLWVSLLLNCSKALSAALDLSSSPAKALRVPMIP